MNGASISVQQVLNPVAWVFLNCSRSFWSGASYAVSTRRVRKFSTGGVTLLQDA